MTFVNGWMKISVVVAGFISGLCVRLYECAVGVCLHCIIQLAANVSNPLVLMEIEACVVMETLSILSWETQTWWLYSQRLAWRSDGITVMLWCFHMMKAFGLLLWDINEMLMVLFCQILINSVSPSRPALLYESVPVSEGSPVLRDMLFSPDLQFIYTLTDRQVRTDFTHSTVLALTTKDDFNTVLQFDGEMCLISMKRSLHLRI